MARTYKISEICGDWALQVKSSGEPIQFLYFNSRSNAELVKAIMEWEDAHPNEAVPYKPTLVQPNEPLKQADLNKMYLDEVWLEYPDGDGETALVVNGKIYSTSSLEGAGLDLEEYIMGETLDSPTGIYKVYRRPPEGEA